MGFPRTSLVDSSTWRKSTYSGPGSAQGCVGTATGNRIVGVRDTTMHEASPVLPFSAKAWAAFTSGLKAS